MKNPETAKEKKKKENTAKLKASVTHGAPGSTHDAHASNDAQASQTMRKASRAMHKHPNDAQASNMTSVECK